MALRLAGTPSCKQCHSVTLGKSMKDTVTLYWVLAFFGGGHVGNWSTLDLYPRPPFHLFILFFCIGSHEVV